MQSLDQTIVIGTRGSALARWQADAVANALHKVKPRLEIEIKVVKTTGDRNLTSPLDKIGDKGLFTKELECALVAGEVDMCVHSMKDVQSELAPGCVIAGMLPRADVRDALVCGPRISGATDLAHVPAGARIATGSLRRVAQLRAQFPQIVPCPVRGNVETRVRKATGEDFEGAILACAGLERLGMKDAISARIDPSVMIPAVGQGAIGIETRADDEFALACARLVSDEPTFRCVSGERLVLTSLNGSCRVPMGAYFREGASADGSRALLADAFVSTLDGSRQARTHREFPLHADALEAARTVLEDLFAQSAREIRDSIDTAVPAGVNATEPKDANDAGGLDSRKGAER
jgi:hydroxymethylbilane synthase